MKTLDELKMEVANTTLPTEMKEFFYNILDTAHVGSLTEQERMQYEANLKSYRDTMSCIRFAKNEGKAEGIVEGILTVAKNLKAQNVPLQTIVESTGLTKEQIDNL